MRMFADLPISLGAEIATGVTTTLLLLADNVDVFQGLRLVAKVSKEGLQLNIEVDANDLFRGCEAARVCLSIGSGQCW